MSPYTLSFKNRVEKDCRKIPKDLLPNIFEHVENLTNTPLPQFNADVKKAETVVAHNLDFDLPIVTTEFLRCRLETGLLGKQHFCTMKTPQIVSLCKLPSKSKRGYKWPTLNELHLQLFETEFTGSHNAGADVEACARCYFELKRREII